MAPTANDQDLLDKGLRDLHLTNEELNKFEKAFKDPEFLKLFEEYAKEVSDPKVKAETDQYLRQLEEQGRGEDVYGKGVVLVAPKPGLVLKSKVMGEKNAPAGTETTTSSRRDQLKKGQKVFINVCTSEKVDRYSLVQARDASGRAGQQLSIPITMGPVRQGTDKQGEPAAVYDLVVHPDTIEFSASSAPVMSTLADTALDQVEAVSHSRLSRNWRRLNIRYKGTEGCTEPPVQCIRTGDGGEAIGGRLKPRADVPGVEVHGAKTAAAVQPPAVPVAGKTAAPVADPQPAKGPASRSTFSFDRPKDKGLKAQAVEDPLQPGFPHDDGSVTPEWTLVHRGQADLAAAWGDAGRGLALDTQVPKELVVRVTLPDVSSAAGVDLDVGERRLTLKVPGRYCLDAPLPYAVEESKGKAKFDKARKQLEVALPVVPPPPPPPSLLQPPPAAALVQELPAQHQNPKEPQMPAAASDEAASVADAHGTSEASGTMAAAGVYDDTNGVDQGESNPGASGPCESAAVEAVTGREGAAAAADSLDAAASHVGEEEALDEVGVKAAPVGSREEPSSHQMTENERKWRELHERKMSSEAGAITEGEGAGAVGTAAASAVAVGSDDVVDGAGAAAAAAASVATAGDAAPLPTVLLRPRLRRDLAMELD